jgi:hypothetical protein
MRPTELVTRFIYTRSAEQVTRSICMRQLLLRTRPVQMCKKRTVRAARIVGTAVGVRLYPHISLKKRARETIETYHIMAPEKYIFK